MTELERLLRGELQLQQQAFIAELKNISKQFEETLREQQKVIERQKQALEQYESMQVEVSHRVTLSQEQFSQLVQSVSSSTEQLTELSNRLTT